LSDDRAVVPYEAVEQRILVLRGQKVMLDVHLAELFCVTTGNLNKAVSRNRLRFPPDFMFQLTGEEYRVLRIQFGILEKGAHSKYLPHAFTEQGVAMLSSVLRSERAILVNIEIMRAFVRMRQAIETHREWAKKLEELETRVGTHDEEIQLIFKALKQLMAEPAKKKKAIGFGAKEAKGKYRSRHA
jgi:hypothetical protein